MRRTVFRRLHAYRRTLVTGAVSLGVVLATLSPAQGAPAAPAQEAEAFANGAAKATAQVLKVAPGVGSLELAIGGGIAVSELRNQLAQGESRSVDLGLIGTSLSAAGSCSGGGGLNLELPQPLTIDNRQGPRSATEDEAPILPGFVGLGTKEAATTDIPSAKAVSTIVNGSGGALLDIGGGRATAEVRSLEGAGREAVATSELSLTILGITLTGLEWRAVHRTGADPLVDATFSIGSGSQDTGLGIPIPLPVDQLPTLEGLLNGILNPLGLGITFPRIVHLTEPTDLIRATPLRIELRDSPLAPLGSATRQLREQLFRELSDNICEAATVALLGDVGVSIVTGTGFAYVELGGAEAMSGEFLGENPFGEVPPPPEPPAPPPPPTDSGSVDFTAPTGSFTPPPVSTPPPTLQEQPRPPKQIADFGPLESVCTSIHPRGASCSEGALPLLGILGLAATGGMAGLDFWRQRKRLTTGGASA